MNTGLYATDEDSSAVERIISQASSSESRILLKAFDVGDPMELSNSSCKCYVPKMALQVPWATKDPVPITSTP